MPPKGKTGNTKKDRPKASAKVRRVAQRVRTTRKNQGRDAPTVQEARTRAREIIKTRPKASAKVRKVAAKVRKRQGGGVSRQEARAKAREILSKKKKERRG